jgi:hypothetical protein
MKNGLIIDDYGNKYWYKDDNYHRDDDLPAIESKSGQLWWFKEGKKHRVKNYAEFTSMQTKAWWKNHERHRLNAPAIIFTNGAKDYYEFGKPQYR